MFETSAMLPRHSFSARDAARAGDVWRLLQEVAVEASTAGGWPPARYRAERNAFVVRSMIVRHALEATYGEPLEAKTWVARMRREMLSTRELRVRSARGEIASARQEWVHVSESLEPVRAPRSLLEAFPEEPGPNGDVTPQMPELAHAIEPHAPHVFSFRAWWTWMDPLDHVNHPAYVDFCDEAIAVAARAAGLAPRAITPVAEELTFRSGVVGEEDVRVESVARGLTADGAAVIAHRILVGDRLCANGTTVRRLIGEIGDSALVAALASAR
ncbi:MAG: thioesterase [Myxococcota bacterium]|nr:thioesterase [Myxococcota bacterium]